MIIYTMVNAIVTLPSYEEKEDTCKAQQTSK